MRFYDIKCYIDYTDDVNLKNSDLVLIKCNLNRNFQQQTFFQENVSMATI